MYDVLEGLKQDEGFRAEAYHCTEGKLTIGYGFNVEAGMTEREAEAILLVRLDAIHEELARRGLAHRLHPDALGVCMNMCYQLGIAGFLRFRKSIELMLAGKYASAGSEILDSRWAKQTPQRAQRLSNILKIIGD